MQFRDAEKVERAHRRAIGQERVDTLNFHQIFITKKLRAKLAQVDVIICAKLRQRSKPWRECRATGVRPQGTAVLNTESSVHT